MYAGTTLTTKSGRIIGVHQKIDRVARRHLQEVLPDYVKFPSAKSILYFEGKNGPDGIKRKSPSVDEPWHFIDPHDVGDLSLVNMIEEHIGNLANALQAGDEQRAAFEAAWMAHAVTDGLTPAHHFPLEAALRDLRQGEGNETRNSVFKKGVMPGRTPIEALRNNWRFWGAKGIMSMHISFEVGIASAAYSQRYDSARPTAEDIQTVKDGGYTQYLLGSIKKVSGMHMYTKYAKSGWTVSMVKQTNKELMPTIIRTVTLGWLYAAWKAQEGSL